MTLLWTLNKELGIGYFVIPLFKVYVLLPQSNWNAVGKKDTASKVYLFVSYRAAS